MSNDKKNSCYFTRNNIKSVDYKDINVIKKFINEAGKIVPIKYSGLSARYQRQVSTAIKKARFLALIPYCDYHKQDF